MWLGEYSEKLSGKSRLRTGTVCDAAIRSSILSLRTTMKVAVCQSGRATIKAVQSGGDEYGRKPSWSPAGGIKIRTVRRSRCPPGFAHGRKMAGRNRASCRPSQEISESERTRPLVSKAVVPVSSRATETRASACQKTSKPA